MRVVLRRIRHDENPRWISSREDAEISDREWALQYQFKVLLLLQLAELAGGIACRGLNLRKRRGTLAEVLYEKTAFHNLRKAVLNFKLTMEWE